MYLSCIEVVNFRGLAYLKLECHKGVNILIGENNTSKTTVLDALRLCLGFGAERRELYLQPEDFHIDMKGTRANTIEVHLTFSEPSTREQGVFVEMLTITNNRMPRLQFHMRFTYDGDRIKRKYWGGENEGQEISIEVLELFYFTYLGALRDATRDLAPSRGNRLSQLFLKLVETEDNRSQYAAAVNEQVRKAAGWNDLLNSGKEKIRNHLQRVTLQHDAAEVEIDFVDKTFRRIVENLKMSVPHVNAQQNAMSGSAKDEPNSVVFEISQNGLGYNNLIYISTVLGDLLERRHREPDSYVALLIEEPEAHLHPQWQNVLFSYLQEIERHGIQVFISSHSPTITAKSNIDSLIVMTQMGQSVKNTPLRTIDLSETHKKYLERFLDVTKSQLFFAKSVVLVEGISEALIIPSFTRLLGKDYNLEKNAVEIVNINGVAFEPFAKFFNSSDAEKRINVHCSIVTDDDRDDNFDVSSRADNALKLRGGMVEVFLATQTFEYELFLANENLVKKAYADLHPQTDLNFDGDLQERAKAFVEKLKTNKDKGIFAQYLAGKIEDGGDYSTFIVPTYIKRALNWAIKGYATETN